MNRHNADERRLLNASPSDRPPRPSLRSSRSALTPTGATAYPPTSKPSRRASLRSGAETAGGSGCDHVTQTKREI